MKRLLYIITTITAALLLLPMLTACDSSDTPTPEPQPTPPSVKESRMAVLVYAVAANSLASDLILDELEMMLGATTVDMDKYDWLVYSVLPTNSGEEPRLERLAVDSQGVADFELLKTYDREIFSTDPERLAAVIADFQGYCQADSYGLILWSHATGWESGNSRHDGDSGEAVLRNADVDSEGNAETDGSAGNPYADIPVAYAFGEDNSQGTSDKMDIDELALAIPDRFFTFIWFDCCYMANIETLYQLRNKCDRYVGYVMEIGAKGMPYDLVMKSLLQDEPDYVAAARSTFDWYNEEGTAVTVTVVDTSYLPDLAKACKKAYLGYDGISTTGLQNYSRRSQKYYDFRQYTARVAEEYGTEGLSEVDDILSKMILYADISEYDFNRRQLFKEYFSGLSCHAVRLAESDSELYYRTLDWYKDAYTSITDQ